MKTASTQSVKETSVVPWDHQSGGETFHVIFDKIWQNAWWVEAHNCPGKTAEDPDRNPWRFLRNATPEEIAKGNPY